MRKAFTLIELMVSIVIITIVMAFLFQSYSSLNQSNRVYIKKVDSTIKLEAKRRVIYLDFLSKIGDVDIKNQDKKSDIIFFQSTNSMHNRINPYIAYVTTDKILYRLESSIEFKEYPLPFDSEFSVESFSEIKRFRIYKATARLNIVDANNTDTNQTSEDFLIDINFSDGSDILLKI